MFRREIFTALRRRLGEPRRFIQVLAGPRQVGKTTLARQLAEAGAMPAHYASADDPLLRERGWLEQQWEAARLPLREGAAAQALLVLDEVQKLPGWSETVKRLWDEDSSAGRPLKVLLLGSSPLLLSRGLTESLAGRFEAVPVTHWSFPEMREAFGLTLEQYVFFGGYPGAAALVAEPERWARYVVDALIETTVSRDILLMTRVDKPALLRRLFQLGCAHSCDIVSYQKMLGQLQESGNTVTLARYLELLAGAGMLVGLQKHAGNAVRARGSSPKLVVLNTALAGATAAGGFEAARRDPARWGRLVESAVGAHLVNSAMGTPLRVEYWRERNREVDFVLDGGNGLALVEVKSGRPRDAFRGMEAFEKAFGPARKLLVGGDGIPIEEFLARPAADWAA